MKNLIYIFAICLLFGSCKTEKKLNGLKQASKVEVKEVDGQYAFYVNGQKFDIKGLGFNYTYSQDFEALSKTGANAVRTWTTKYADTILKAAEKHDFMVAMGISVGKEMYGFDYNDSKAVAEQLEHVKSIINKYKDHPKILCWIVGNELNLLFNEDGSLKDVNPKVYDAVSDITDFIHKEDPNHPVTMTFAGVNQPHIKVAMERVPQIDIVSVQVYADLENIETRMDSTGISQPYMVTEFGPKGFWEMPKTEWNREIEEPSGPKTDGVMHRINKGLLNNNSGKCLGGFAFVWGQKQERTPTWYGMHLKDGSQTQIIDELTNLWTGSYPKNRAPRVDSLLLNTKKSIDNIYLKPNTQYTAQVFASEPDGHTLAYKWDVKKEVIERSQGGENEIEPPMVDLKVIKEENGTFIFNTPTDEGDYRILVYVYDNKGKVGYANIPFFIKN